MVIGQLFHVAVVEQNLGFVVAGAGDDGEIPVIPHGGIVHGVVGGLGMHLHEGVIDREGLLSPPEAQAELVRGTNAGIGVGHVDREGLTARRAHGGDDLAARNDQASAVKGKVRALGGDGVAERIGLGLGGLGGGSDILGQIVEVLIGD